MATIRDFTADDIDRRKRGRQLGKARSRGTLPNLPEADDLELTCEWLTRAIRPPAEFTFESFQRASQRRIDSCVLVFRRGAERKKIHFDEQADLDGTGAKIRSRVNGNSGGWTRMGLLNPSEASDFFTALCSIGQILDRYDERDETRKWVEQLLDVAFPLTGYTIAEAGPTRHDALMALRAQGEFKQADAIQMGRGAEWLKRPVRFVDQDTDEQWVRAGETFFFVKHVAGAEKVDRGKLRDRLGAIGMSCTRFEHHADPHPKAVMYRLTDALIEYIGDPPAVENATPNGKPEAIF